MSARALILMGLALVGAAPGRAETLRGAIAAELEESLPESLVAVEVRAPTAALKKGSTVALHWSVPPKAGWVTFAAEVKVKQSHTTTWGTALLVEKRSVLVARRDLQPGEKISLEEVAIERRAVQGEVPNAVPTGESFATRAIKKGAILVKEDLSVPAAARGASVRVLVRSSGLVIATSGVLEQRAQVGERAMVRVPSTQRVLAGVLADVGTVEIQGGRL